MLKICLESKVFTRLATARGWAAGPCGTRMWGRHGAAGLALVARAGDSWTILMQHRATWTSHGDTWALPGGAREASEDARQAAGREVAEGLEIYPDSYEVLGQAVTAGPFPADPDRPGLPGGGPTPPFSHAHRISWKPIPTRSPTSCAGSP